jgi:hypothetical protein
MKNNFLKALLATAFRNLSVVHDSVEPFLSDIANST